MGTSGTRIGRYELHSLLGAGGMGQVWEATLHGPAGFRKPVALKVLAGNPKTDEERDQLVREAHMGALLSHPNIVATHELGEIDGQWFVAMELVRGPTVAALRGQGALPPSAILDIGIQVCAGLHHIHTLRVNGEPVVLVHQDIKPANLLVDRSGLVKIADLGIARFQTGPGEAAGTFGYIAPEQLEGRSEPRSDIFALGVVLFVLATGVRPFGLDVSQVERILDRDGFLDPVDDAVPGLGAIVARCLRFDAASRWADALALSDALRTLRTQFVGPGVVDLLRHPDTAVDPTESDTDLQTAPLGKRPARGEEPRLPQGQLPAVLDRFVGRFENKEELIELLSSDHRLVTILGAGGMGKTRLVLEVARALQARRSVWFCDCTEAITEEGLFAAVARGLDVPLGQNPLVQLGHALAGRPGAVVVLDNLEQVAAIARDTLGRWLQRATDVQFLITSRVVLGVAGEKVFSLDALTTDDAVALFLARVQRPSGNANTEPARRSVEKLVTLLDGMPLAIELAAARAGVLSVDQMLTRMKERFQLLAGPKRGRPKRQQTLTATLDWSWSLLAPWEQSALAQLSVFDGGFTLEAAEAVLALSSWAEAPWAIDVIQGLVEKSLLRARSATDGETRFGMFGSVQQYAAERLREMGDVEGAEARHGVFFARMGTDEAIEALDRHGGVERRRALAAELDNLVIATRRATARGDGALAAAALRAAWGVLELRGPFQVAVELAEGVAAIGTLATRVRGIAAYLLGRALSAGGRGEEARAHLDAALVVAREGVDRSLEARALVNLGTIHREQGRPDEAQADFDRALEAAQQVGSWLEGWALGDAGILHFEMGRLDEARVQIGAALDIARAVGNRRYEGIALCNLGTLLLDQGRLDEANAHYDLSLAVNREVGNRRTEGIALGNLGDLHRQLGRLNEAEGYFAAALTLDREVGNRRAEGEVLGNLGELHHQQGRLVEARAHYDAALEVHDEVGNRSFKGSVLCCLANLHQEQGRLDEARVSFQAGVALLLATGDKFELARRLCARSRFEYAAGDVDASGRMLAEAEVLAQELQLGPDSHLGRGLAEARALLATNRSKSP